MKRKVIQKGKVISLCPSCTNPTINKIGKVPTAYHFGKKEFDFPVNEASLFECSHCGLVFKNPCIDKSTINYLYTIQPSITWENKSERLDFTLITDYLQIKTQNTNQCLSILDIGCFNGDLLDLLKIKLNNNQYRYYGIEPSEEAAHVCKERGIKILGKFLDELNSYKGEKFDIIILVDVFEHLQKTNETFSVLYKFLNEGGSIIVSTGWVNSTPFSKYLHNYHYVALPEHLIFLNQKHIDWLSKKFGFQITYQYTFLHGKSNTYLKNILLVLSFFILSALPESFFFPLSNRLIKKLAKIRGRGVLNISNTNDHIFVDFQKISQMS